jgi:hypothetical protein
MRYRLYEIDCFTGQVEPEALSEFDCDREDQIPRIADQLAPFYRVLNSAGALALEKLPTKMVQGKRIPVIDLYYGVLDPEEAEALFPGGMPASSDAPSSPFTVAAQLIRESLAVEVKQPGTWVSAWPRQWKAPDPVSMPQIGHIDYELASGITARVNFLGKL